MAETLSEGVIVPNANGGELISTSGVSELRTAGISTNTALASKASVSYVDTEVGKAYWWRGTLPSGNLDNVTDAGQYALVSGNTYTGTPPGFAPGDAGTLSVTAGTGAWGAQEIRGHGSEQYIASRATRATNNWWPTWRESTKATEDAALRHQLRVGEFKRRRGGVIGTGGTGAVAFRFDHYYQDWATKILPLMREHQIIGSMAMQGTGTTGVGGTGYDWIDLQSTHVNDGLEIMCHSYDHQSTYGASNLEREIVWARDTWLAGRMPEVLIEGWMQPGAEYGADMGQHIDSQEKLWGTLAGKMLMANYAVVSGHRDGYYRQLTGDVDAGLAHVTIETDTTAENAKSIIDEAVKRRAGVVFMMHPSNIGTSGYMSTAVLGEIFAYVAQLRDAGKLQNLTVGGMSLADAWSGRREDLAVNGNFSNGFDGWSSGDWTIQSGGALSPASASILSQSEYISRRSVISGSPREVVITARGVGGTGALRVDVDDTRSGTALAAQKDLTFTTGDYTTQRMFFTIPYWRSGLPAITLQWAMHALGGSRVQIQSVQVRSI